MESLSAIETERRRLLGLSRAALLRQCADLQVKPEPGVAKETIVELLLGDERAVGRDDVFKIPKDIRKRVLTFQASLALIQRARKRAKKPINRCACGCGGRPISPDAKWVLGHAQTIMREARLLATGETKWRATRSEVRLTAMQIATPEQLKRLVREARREQESVKNDVPVLRKRRASRSGGSSV